MPTAQEIRTYLEKNGIQAALTTAVNEAIQAQAPNALEFIGDRLVAASTTKAVGGGAGGDEGNAGPVSLDGEGNTGPISPETTVSLDGDPVQAADAAEVAEVAETAEAAETEAEAQPDAVVEPEAKAEGEVAETEAEAEVEETEAEAEAPLTVEDSADVVAAEEAASPEPDDFFKVSMMPPTPPPPHPNAPHLHAQSGHDASNPPPHCLPPP